jgi:hypothetical protein
VNHESREPVEDSGIHCRMLLERRAPWSLQTISFPFADRNPQPELQCRLEQRPWNFAPPERIDDIDRLPEYEFRNEVGSLAHAERGVRSEPCDIDGNIRGGVACADHEDALAAEWVGPLVGRGVHDPSGERTRVFRYKRLAVVAGADQQAVEELRPCVAVRDHANRPSPIPLQSLERGVDLPDVDLPRATEKVLEARLHGVGMERLRGQEPENPELERHPSPNGYSTVVVA